MTRQLALLSLSLLLIGLLSAAPASAQTEGVGVGASLGVTNGTSALDRNPIGLNLKAWLSDRQAVAGLSSFFISGSSPASQSYWVLQGDYLFHNFNKLSVGEGFLALYIGAGGQYTVTEDTDNQFALRSPLGVNYLFGSAPIDVFAEVSPTVRITDPSALRFDGAIGFRYFFNGSSNGSGPDEDGSSN